jgi:predicted secreted hydrolase
VRRGGHWTAATTVLALALAGCSGGPILANQPLDTPVPPTPGPTLAPVADPVPIVFPRDDGPHDRLTEWWYYTGHLRETDGNGRYGFEAVIFRAERGDVPVTWASHLALTDEVNERFLYAQRSEVGAGIDRSARGADGAPTGFDLEISGADPNHPFAATGSPWVLKGSGGRDRITAAFSPAEGAAAGGRVDLSLSLEPTKPPALHDQIGWVPFGPAGGSYYYSRTALDAEGALFVDGAFARVTGNAWFDHQWGDFISVGGGGWDWFAVNLEDGTDLTISQVRAADGTFPLVYGTLVSRIGEATHLEPSDFSLTSTGAWSSPHSGAIYPAAWRIEIPARHLVIGLTPTVSDQELDTRATTGVVYWEGSQRVTATVDGEPVGGQAYVELTGYAPAADSAIPSPP